MEHPSSTFIVQQSWYFKWKFKVSQYENTVWETQIAIQVEHATTLLQGNLNFCSFSLFVTLKM